MPSCRSAVASVTGWASASHCSAVSRSAWPPSRSASLVAGSRSARWPRCRRRWRAPRRGSVAVEAPARPGRAAAPRRRRPTRPVSSRSRACASPDHVGQQVGAGHAGVHPELHERHAEPGAGRGVPEVAGQRQAQPGADRGAVDGGDGGHLEAPDRQPGPVERHHPGRAAGRRSRPARSAIQRGVAARAEGACPRRSRRPRARTRSAASSSIGRDPGRGHLVGHRVALVGVVEGQQGDALGGALEAEVGERGRRSAEHDARYDAAAEQWHARTRSARCRCAERAPHAWS